MISNLSAFQVLPSLVEEHAGSELYDQSLQHFGQADEWLVQDRVKFAISAYCYEFAERKKAPAIEIGAGLNRFITALSSKSDFAIIDPLFSYSEKQIVRMKKSGVKIFREDWVECDLSMFSNRTLLCLDLFPNVDQRVERFLRLILEHFTNFVVTLTVNDSGLFYLCKRLDGDEIMTVSPWTSSMLNALLVSLNMPTVQIVPTGLFGNGREVVLLRKG